jgi:hypothetical protein
MKTIYKNVTLILLAGSLFLGCSSKEVSKYSTLDQIELPTKNYKSNQEKSTELSFATVNPLLTINFNASTDLHKSLMKRLKNDVNKLSCKIPTEIKKILISKGINVTDNYWNRNDMTFSQKRDSSILFYPVIQIYIDQNTVDILKSVNNGRAKKTKTVGKLQVRAKVELVALEPLSGEKIWLKSLPLKRKKFETDISYEGYLKSSKNIFTVDSKAKNIAKEVDDLIVEIYNKVIEGVVKYVDYEEFLLLNKDIAKIKNIKRY